MLSDFQIKDRYCRVYGDIGAEYLLLQMTDDRELKSMDKEVAMVAETVKQPFVFAAIHDSSWNDELSPWPAPAIWGKDAFGGEASNTLRFLIDQAIPELVRRFDLPEHTKIILGGYSLAGLFALWASTQTDLFHGVAAASPSVWYPDWMAFEQQYPIQAQKVYLNLGDREEYTKNHTMAAVGDNIRTLYNRLQQRKKNCILEWNSGGHFRNTDLRTAKAFQWVLENQSGELFPFISHVQRYALYIIM